MTGSVAKWCVKHSRHYQRQQFQVDTCSEKKLQGNLRVVTHCKMCKAEYKRKQYAKQPK